MQSGTPGRRPQSKDEVSESGGPCSGTASDGISRVERSGLRARFGCTCSVGNHERKHHETDPQNWSHSWLAKPLIAALLKRSVPRSRWYDPGIAGSQSILLAGG